MLLRMEGVVRKGKNERGVMLQRCDTESITLGERHWGESRRW